MAATWNTGLVSDATDQWYWDLKKNKAVPDSERGPGDHTLGPYATKVEAENWKSKVDERNAAWKAADDEWNDGEQPAL